MDWLSSDQVGTPTDTQATIAEAYFLCVVRVEGSYAARKTACDSSVQLSVGDSHGKFVVEKELKSACEDLVCD
jgi:hypothetical protein